MPTKRTVSRPLAFIDSIAAQESWMAAVMSADGAVGIAQPVVPNLTLLGHVGGCTGLQRRHCCERRTEAEVSAGRDALQVDDDASGIVA